MDEQVILELLCAQRGDSEVLLMPQGRKHTFFWLGPFTPVAEFHFHFHRASRGGTLLWLRSP